MPRFWSPLLGAFALFGASSASAEPDLSTCGAQALKRHIGAPVEALKRVRQGDARYVRAGCAMTMDYKSGRLTVVYDRKTDRIMRLGCN
jgi:hypothetical protein